MPDKPKSYSQRKAEKLDRRDSDKLYEQKRKSNPQLAAAKRIRSSQRWRDCRAKKLRESPLCCDPFKTHEKENIPVLAQQVNHIRPLAQFPNLAFELDNLASICTKCHARISIMERKGEKTLHLFRK